MCRARLALFACLLSLAYDSAATPQVYRWVAPADTSRIQDYRLRTGLCGSTLNLGFRIVPKTSVTATMEIPADDRVYCAQVVSMGIDGSESVPLELPMALFPAPVTFSATITANPLHVAPGAAITLTWSSVGAASCRGWNGQAIALSGTETVNANASTAYGITCENALGDFTAAVAPVTVKAAVPPPVNP